MKKFLLLVTLLFSICLINAQNPVELVLKKYFRTHPFNMLFSSFINSLKKDSLFTIDDYYRRTDSTFFFLSGTYKKFNPFHYQAAEVRMVISESELSYSDSLNTIDTIMTIQMMGITDSGIANKNQVIKEFQRFHENQGEKFWKNNYKNVDQHGETIAEIFNYFVYPYSVSPFAIAWGQLPDTHKYTFTITLRCKIKENVADLLTPPE